MMSVARFRPQVRTKAKRHDKQANADKNRQERILMDFSLIYTYSHRINGLLDLAVTVLARLP